MSMEKRVRRSLARGFQRRPQISPSDVVVIRERKLGTGNTAPLFGGASSFALAAIGAYKYQLYTLRNFARISIIRGPARASGIVRRDHPVATCP